MSNQASIIMAGLAQKGAALREGVAMKERNRARMSASIKDFGATISRAIQMRQKATEEREIANVKMAGAAAIAAGRPEQIAEMLGQMDISTTGALTVAAGITAQQPDLIESQRRRALQPEKDALSLTLSRQQVDAGKDAASMRDFDISTAERAQEEAEFRDRGREAATTLSGEVRTRLLRGESVLGMQDDLKAMLFAPGAYNGLSETDKNRLLNDAYGEALTAQRLAQGFIDKKAQVFVGSTLSEAINKGIIPSSDLSEATDEQLMALEQEFRDQAQTDEQAGQAVQFMMKFRTQDREFGIKENAANAPARKAARLAEIAEQKRRSTIKGTVAGEGLAHQMFSAVMLRAFKEGQDGGDPTAIGGLMQSTKGRLIDAMMQNPNADTTAIGALDKAFSFTSANLIKDDAIMDQIRFYEDPANRQALLDAKGGFNAQFTHGGREWSGIPQSWPTQDPATGTAALNAYTNKLIADEVFAGAQAGRTVQSMRSGMMLTGAGVVLMGASDISTNIMLQQVTTAVGDPQRDEIDVWMEGAQQFLDGEGAAVAPSDGAGAPDTGSPTDDGVVRASVPAEKRELPDAGGFGDFDPAAGAKRTFDAATEPFVNAGFLLSKEAATISSELFRAFHQIRGVTDNDLKHMAYLKQQHEIGLLSDDMYINRVEAEAPSWADPNPELAQEERSFQMENRKAVRDANVDPEDLKAQAAKLKTVQRQRAGLELEPAATPAKLGPQGTGLRKVKSNKEVERERVAGIPIPRPKRGSLSSQRSVGEQLKAKAVNAWRNRYSGNQGPPEEQLDAAVGLANAALHDASRRADFEAELKQVAPWFYARGIRSYRRIIKPEGK